MGRLDTAQAQRREIERLTRLNQVELERIAALTRAKLERQEAAAQRLQAKRAELFATAQQRSRQKLERFNRVQARAQSARERQKEDAMKLAVSIQLEQRARPPVPVTEQLCTQRIRRDNGGGVSTPKDLQHRPPTATKQTGRDTETEREAETERARDKDAHREPSAVPTPPARPRTAPECTERQRERKTEALVTPRSRNFRSRDAPPMPALTPEELERLGMSVKRKCGICLRQFLLSDLPGVTSWRAITRLRESWVEQLGTAEPVSVDVRTSKPAQCYSTVRLCVFCFQFVTGGVNDGPDNDEISANTMMLQHQHKDPASCKDARKRTSTSLLTASPPTMRLNGSSLPTRYGRRSPELGDRRLLAPASMTPTAQNAAIAAAVQEAKAQAERKATERKETKDSAGNLRPKVDSRDSHSTRHDSNAAARNENGQKRAIAAPLMRPRVGAQRPQHRSKKPNQRSPRAKLFATSTLPKSASSARCTYDLSYRRRPSPSTQRPPRALSERLGDLVSRASAAQEKDDPESVSVLLLEALKLAPENAELARLQAKVASAAKARVRSQADELQTARWIERLAFGSDARAKHAKMLASASIDVDLFVSKQMKVFTIEVNSMQELDQIMELIAQKKATGEIPEDQEFRVVSTADAIVTRKREFTRKTKEEDVAEAQARIAELEAETVREEAEKMEAANKDMDRFVN